MHLAEVNFSEFRSREPYFNRPRVLILDEATSALDTRTESSLLKHLMAHQEGVTVLMITHRVTSLDRSWDIRRLKNGQLTRDSVG